MQPPKDLVLHLNRSIHYGGHAGKNPCRIIFPEVLDITPYTTSGQLSTKPQAPISTPPPPLRRSTTPTQALFATPRVLYRLAAVVCHYGGHSFGHYVCFRRKPQFKAHQQDSSSQGLGKAKLDPPTMACPYGCECVACRTQGPVRDSHSSQYGPGSGRGWLRISDDSVEECGIERVLAEGGSAFLLFYERAVLPRPTIYMSNGSPRSSEETVRPALYVGMDGEFDGVTDTESNGAGSVNGNGSALLESSLANGKPIESSVVGIGLVKSSDNLAGSPSSSFSERTMHHRPRVVRRTTAGRGRSASVATIRPSSSHSSSNGSSLASSAPTPGIVNPKDHAQSAVGEKPNGLASLFEGNGVEGIHTPDSATQELPDSTAELPANNVHQSSSVAPKDTLPLSNGLKQQSHDQVIATIPEPNSSKLPSINGHIQVQVPHPSPNPLSSQKHPVSSSSLLTNGRASPSRPSHSHNPLHLSPSTPKSSSNEFIPDRASVNLKA